MALKNRGPVLGFSGFLCAFGFIAVVIILAQSWSQWQANRWPETTAQIESVRTGIARTHTPVSYRLSITYRYEVDGNAYIGDRWNYGAITSNDYRRAERYEEGDTLTIRYNPRRPGKSVVDPGDPWDVQWSGVVIFMTMWLGAGGWFVWAYRQGERL
ncbi:DUF3592 domain-containing protein [Phycisphaerales bacterium AB-hyl4]|uniref:DUF3592 domain-containing protein n=1 Tax=Natronomicrosphaera hydrolytica TaxID=3242702 RepID=A0ABV4UBN0_9BACT